jgi:hypothetical protein
MINKNEIKEVLGVPLIYHSRSFFICFSVSTEDRVALAFDTAWLQW